MLYNLFSLSANCLVYPLMFMNAQAEYEDVCARHEYEFGIHLHHIYIYSSIRLEITAKTDNIRIVVKI